MKTQKFLLSILLVFGLHLAQAQVVKKGEKILNLGLGLGNSYYSGYGYSSTLPPLSGSLEVIINDDLFDDGKGALGVGGYAGTFGYKYHIYGAGYDYTSKYTDFVLGPRGYVHYNFLDKLDTYTGLLIGYNIVSVSETGSYSGYNVSSSGLIWSWFIGGRYYFNDNLAGMVELGYGIAYLNIGVALKL